jgi:hypothetical protein
MGVEYVANKFHKYIYIDYCQVKAHFIHVVVMKHEQSDKSI